MTFRFVVLHHTIPAAASRASHWDLMLEAPAPSNQIDFVPGLWTFEVSIPPERWLLVPSTLVQRLPNHREMYLNYEGIVSGGRGNVVRVLKGTIDWQVMESELLILDLKSDAETKNSLRGILQLKLRTIPLNSQQWHMELIPHQKRPGL